MTSSLMARLRATLKEVPHISQVTETFLRLAALTQAQQQNFCVLLFGSKHFWQCRQVRGEYMLATSAIQFSLT